MNTTTHRSTRVRLATIATLLLVAAVALAGCGGSDTGSATAVPTRETASQAAGGGDQEGAPAQASTAERPLVRADTSNAERERYMRAYQQCLHDGGVPVDAPEPDGPGEFYVDASVESQYRSQFESCLSKKPESLTDRFQRENPEAYQAQLQKMIACLRSQGVNAIFIAPDGWGLSDSEAGSADLDNSTIDRRESKAFGQ